MRRCVAALLRCWLRSSSAALLLRSASSRTGSALRFGTRSALQLSFLAAQPTGVGWLVGWLRSVTNFFCDATILVEPLPQADAQAGLVGASDDGMAVVKLLPRAIELAE
jgi:hypothetical protein